MAITGCGVVSALGATARETWEGLVAGRVGIRPVTLFDTSRERTRLAAEIPAVDASRLFGPKELERASRGDRIGLLAATEAMGDSGLDLMEVDTGRAALVVGGGGGGLPQGEGYLEAVHAGGRAPRPSSALGFFPAATADLIASRLGLRGGAMTIMNACSSATVAIGHAAMRIRSGELDLVLAGGVETLSRTTYSGFNALRLVDPDPCRPFDRDRRGLSLGECAAFLVLERLEAARGRGARIAAEVAGWGMSADGHHATAPHPDGDGIARAMRAALRVAGIDPGEVDHVNAHGTGTEQNDRVETRALKAVFGARAHLVPVVSIKGMVGHCLGAAGAIEAFATAMTIARGLVPPTAGLRTPDPECDLDYVPERARRCEVRVAVSNSLAFGGNNGALVLRRAET